MQDATWHTSLGKSLIAVSILAILGTEGQAQSGCTRDMNTIENAGRGSSESIDENFDCLVAELEASKAENVKLRDELRTLNTKLTEQMESVLQAFTEGLDQVTGIVSEGPTAIPPGAVLAFDRSDLDENTCPMGWEPYREARARVIVGAGEPGVDGTKYAFDANGEPLTWYSLREHGGTESVTLNPSQIAQHTHDVTMKDGERIKFIGRKFSVDPNAGTSFIWHADGSRAGPVLSAEPQHELKPIDPHNNMPPFLALYFCKKT